MAEDRFVRLAKKIEGLRRKDESSAARRHEILRLRGLAAGRLHQICASFAARINAILKDDQLDLVPVDPPAVVEDTNQQIMLNVRGRILLITLEAPSSLASTDNFKTPYILQGEVRFFNQELLDESLVEEHGLFFCPGEGPKDEHGRRQGAWLYWNARNYKSGPVDEEYFAGLMDQIM